MDYDIIIVGAGAAGLTAGIYTSRARLKILLVEKGMPGGLTATTDLIENYPGFPDGINGMDLMNKMKSQAQKFGTKIHEFEEVKRLNLVEDAGASREVGTAPSIEIETDKGKYITSAVIIASGTIPRPLNIPGEKKFIGRGISYCATCDGPLFRNKDIAVVGCGNSGLQEGEYLLKFVKSITFIEFLPYMTAEKILQERLSKQKEVSPQEVLPQNVKFMLNHRITSINGKNEVSSITVIDRQTGKEKVVKVSGVFIYVGLLPNSDFLKSEVSPQVVKLDASGYVITNEQMETSVPGIFAAGDVRSKEVRQVATAVGERA